MKSSTTKSKYALPSAQARKNSKNSPWRKHPACDTKRAHELRSTWDKEGES